ncbi:MAG: hypothetical protein RL748_3942 [Pseudomonadota bacterium]
MDEEINWWEASAEECFAEAMARIGLAQDTGSKYLDLSGLQHLAAIPVEITRLTNLKELNIRRTAIADLVPLATLTELQSLDCRAT